MQKHLMMCGDNILNVNSINSVIINKGEDTSLNLILEILNEDI